MKKKETYASKAQLLTIIIDIAIDSFINYPPENFEPHHLKQFIDGYLEVKNNALNPQPQFHNVNSLKYLYNDVLTYFQEGSGEAVNAFWKEAGKKNLGIVRVNRFEKILKRGKINNRIEYEILIDLYTSYIESNTLPEAEVTKINNLIKDFEKRSPTLV